MRASKFLTRSAMVVVGFVIGLAVLFVPYHRSDMTPQRVRSLIESSLRQNADRQEVEAFLKKNKISYSLSGGNSNVINASIPGTSKSLLIEGSLFIVFTFDANARLVSSDVREAFTGP